MGDPVTFSFIDTSAPCATNSSSVSLSGSLSQVIFGGSVCEKNIIVIHVLKQVEVFYVFIHEARCAICSSCFLPINHCVVLHILLFFTQSCYVSDLFLVLQHIDVHICNSASVTL